MDVETKRASQSTTIWAGLFTVAAAMTPSLLANFGVTTGPNQQAMIDAAAQLAAAIGGVLAVYGRLMATQRIA